MTNEQQPATREKFDSPQWMQDNAARGLDWNREGYGGDGLVERTLDEARQMAAGFVSEDKAIRMAAWFARHMQDIDGVDADQDPPTPGMVAHALWGGWPRSESERAQAWAQERADQVRGESANDTHKQEETPMQFKTYTAELTAPEEAGTVEAIVSVFGNVDYAGDRIVPGAFAKTLAEFEANGKNIPFVWSHDYDVPESYIGKVVEAEETSEGLRVKAQLFDTPRAQVVRELLVNRVVTEFSFAYEILDQEKAADGANELRELRILEVGPTLRGANPMTRLIDAKAVAVQARKATEPAEPAGKELPDNYRSALSEDVPEGRACGNCAFYDESKVTEDGDKTLAYCTRWDEYVDGGFYCNAWQNDDDDTQEENASAELRGEKAGRTLSSKNEAALSAVADLLSKADATLKEVLSSVQATQEPQDAKAEDPETVQEKGKAEERWDPKVALALIQLAMLD